MGPHPYVDLFQPSVKENDNLEVQVNSARSTTLCSASAQLAASGEVRCIQKGQEPPIRVQSNPPMEQGHALLAVEQVPDIDASLIVSCRQQLRKRSKAARTG